MIRVELVGSGALFIDAHTHLFELLQDEIDALVHRHAMSDQPVQCLVDRIILVVADADTVGIEADGAFFSSSSIRAGIPAAVAPAGTSFTTTALEPIFAPSPIVIGPSIFAPAPTTTPLPSVGWRLPSFQEVPPNVTPW